MTDMETADPGALLDALIERVSGGTGRVTERLAPADEDQASGWLRALVVEGGKTGIEQAMDRMLRLPWAPGVKALVAAWPDLKVTARRALIKPIVETPADLRFRLSLSRGLHEADAETAAKLVVAACKEIGDKPEPVARGVFSGVMIGRGKPWLLALALADLKPAEARCVRDVVLACAFPGGFPPQTHVNLLKWLAGAGLLADLDETRLAPVIETARRWSHRVQTQAREDLGEGLPSALVEALASKGPVPPEAAVPSAAGPDAGLPPLEGAPEPPAGRPWREPAREMVPRRGGPNDRGEPARLDPASTLRRVADQVAMLQRDLDRARTQLAQREAPDRQSRSGGRMAAREPSPTSEDPESLARRNAQLEETVAELRARLEDLAGHHEDVAASMKVAAENPESDPVLQLRALIGIKLARQHAEFQALRNEPDDVVLRQHYRDMLAHIFEVLAAQGVEFPEVEV